MNGVKRQPECAPHGPREGRHHAERDGYYGGFTLVELLVVIAVIVILLALLLPAIAASRASSRAAQCSQQLEQIGSSLTKAGLERMAAVPSQWTAKLAPFLIDSAKMLRCPDDMAAVLASGSPPASVAPSYGINARAFRFSGGDSAKIVMLDYKLGVANVVGPQGTDDWNVNQAPRHRGQVNVLSAAGSVDRRAPDQIDPRICDVHDRLWRPTRDFTLLKPGCTKDVSLAPAATTTGTSTSAASSTTTTTTSTTTTTTTSGTTTGSSPCLQGRYVKVTLPTTDFLHLAEVQVFNAANVNVALAGTATQSSSAADNAAAYGPQKAIDNNSNGDGFAMSITHTKADANAWWQVDLGSVMPISKIVVFNRTDCCMERMGNARVDVLDASQAVVWTQNLPDPMVGIPFKSLDVCGSGTTTGGSTTGSSTTTGGCPAIPNVSDGLVAHYTFEVPAAMGLSNTGFNHAAYDVTKCVGVNDAERCQVALFKSDNLANNCAGCQVFRIPKQVLNGNTKWTISYWYKENSADTGNWTNDSMIGFGTPCNDNFLIYLVNHPHATMWNQQGCHLSNAVGVAGGNYVAGQWHHYAAALRTSTDVLYSWHNGVPTLAGPWYNHGAVTLTDAGGVTLMGSDERYLPGVPYPNSGAVGFYDDIRIYNRYLSDAEVCKIWHDGLPPAQIPAAAPCP